MLKLKVEGDYLILRKLVSIFLIMSMQDDKLWVLAKENFFRVCIASQVFVSGYVNAALKYNFMLLDRFPKIKCIAKAKLCLLDQIKESTSLA